MDWTTTRKPARAAIAAIAATAVVGGCLLVSPAANAEPNADIGYPTFTGSPNPVPATGVTYTPGNQLQAILDGDIADGAGVSPEKDFWIDEMLARYGTAGSFDDTNQWLFSRGRAAFMKTHTPGTLGFQGQLAYWESIDNRGGYTIATQVNGANVTLTEDTAQRKQTPSYWRSVHRNAATGLEIVQTKFITDANVLVTNLEVKATGAAQTVTLRAASPYATVAAGQELTGTVAALNNLTTIFPRFSGDGFAPDGTALVRTVAVPAGGSTSVKLQLGLVTNEIPASRTDYDAFRAATPAAAFATHVRAYNQWWADNIPYLDTPEDNIDKTLFYRWWLMRFNFLDADIPGNDYQFPTSMEGVLGYNNAIVLTTGMFIDDLKYFRDPIYSYGPWVSAGETSKSYKFVDNPGDPANWSNSYTQYISEAAWRSYQLHGGPTAIAENLAEYAEYDVEGLIDAYDFNDNGLIEYNWGAMTGNDADAVSFDWRPGYMDRAENAYLYSNARAAADAYRVAGNDAKADEMDAFAQNVKEQILDVLWNPDSNLLEHAMADNGEHVPWKEINNYYPFTVGLMPKPGDPDYADDYVDALRLWADDKEYPIFPFYTANQADKAEAAAEGDPGSNNFSIINSTVTFRMLSRVLRDYPTDAIDEEWYKKLLYWNAWAHYQNGGDNRLPDQNEFWSDGSADPQRIGYRSWIHHTILGTTNFTMIEDAMGLRPRSDAKIELDPIDIDWDHFTANNIRYRDKDLTVTWDAPGGERHYGDAVPEGYSVFLDGELAFTVDGLGKVVYDPATGEVDAAEGLTVTAANTASVKAPQEVRFGNDARVVDLFAKAGADASDQSSGSPNLAAGKAATATFSATGRAPAAAVNGTTINEPFWGTAGSPNAKDTITIDLGSAQTFDDARVYFYNTSSSATVAGYSEPSMYAVEYRSGGQWHPVPAQARTPVYPQANFNHIQFPEVTGDALRVTVTHAAGSKTGIKEVQLLHTGVEAPVSTNQAPLVEAWVKPGVAIPGQADLVGTAKDDGLPAGTLSSQWSVVSAPAGGLALFDAPTSPSTIARFTAAGTYVLRLTSTDGEWSSSVDVTVQGSVATQGTNVAPSGTPTAEYTAGWNNVNAVNDGRVLHSGGQQTDLWGTWSGSRPATRWIQYTWQTPVRIDSTEVAFWSDQTNVSSGAGVNVPKAWKAQYWNGTGWVDVTGADQYGVARTATNLTAFDAVTTTRLRLVLSAAGPGTGADPYAAVGVSEWRVFAEAPSAIEPIDVRTSVGDIPELPEKVDAIYADGSRSAEAVAWGPITEDQVASEGTFDVVGIVAGSPVPARASIWVRATAPGQINSVDAVQVKTAAGVAPQLPATVGVLYNDGSREDLPVQWEAVDPADYATDGTFTVAGTVQSAIAGTKAATATVTVGEGGGEGPDTTAPVATVSFSPQAPAGGWHTGAVNVTASATDNRDTSPSLEVQVDGGAWTAYTAAVSVTADGAHTVRARATDDAGNVSPVVETTFRIDTTAPTLTPAADATARTVKATAADAGSGVDALEYRIDDDEEWIAYTGTILVGLEATVVHLRATDEAGNVSAVTDVEVPESDGTHRRNVALLATPTASYTAGWNTVDGLNDDVAPTSSGDVNPNDNAFVWGAWPQITDQWVQYEWAEPVTVDELGVYFIQNLDAGGAGIAVPEEWTAQYLDENGEWVDVTATSEYGVEIDEFNVVTFEPVTTTGLRLVLDAQGTTEGQGSLGIKEWQVFEVAGAPDPFDVEVVLTSRCVAGKVVLVATAANHGDETVKVALTTAYGAKTFAAVAPGAKASQAFTTRLKDVPAGTVEAVVTGVVDDETVTQEYAVSHDPFGC
ncbi:Ig-like domain-containing protein [Microbacterium thalassium]|uniref:OmpL47-type beta-barrel domain-containing protein n=1 Tax=Microbacterium TaxID=33882 RepID=UPI002948C224|nr:Ig-like domain-containing protein [Microbacterium thalassium]